MLTCYWKDIICHSIITCADLCSKTQILRDKNRTYVENCFIVSIRLLCYKQ